MPTIPKRLHRALSILRRLQLSPTDRETLMAHVQAELEDGYDPAKTSKALNRQFEDDIQFLREELGIAIPSYDRQTA